MTQKTNATSAGMAILADMQSLMPARSQLLLQGAADGGQKRDGKKV